MAKADGRRINVGLRQAPTCEDHYARLYAGVRGPDGLCLLMAMADRIAGPSMAAAGSGDGAFQILFLLGLAALQEAASLPGQPPGGHGLMSKPSGFEAAWQGAVRRRAYSIATCVGRTKACPTAAMEASGAGPGR